MKRIKFKQSLLRPLLTTCLALATAGSALVGPVQAQTQAVAAADTAKRLQVAVKPAAPFAMQNEAGDWTGISVELWQDIAKQQNLKFRWLPVATVSEQITALQNGSADIAVGAITVTAERELQIDFSNPFYNTGLGVATNSQGNSLLATAWGFLSLPFLKAVGILCAVLLIIGVLIWLIERRSNEAFGGSAARGIGNGFWWSAVTMTTVGYGDKSPVTLAGRTVGTIWMFVSIITISGFTAAIASSFTLNQLGSKVQDVSDLFRVRTATVSSSSSSDFLRAMSLNAKGYASAEEALRDVDSNKQDALVYDKPLLQYLVSKMELEHVKILPLTLAKQDYALALQDQSPYRESVNRALLDVVQGSDWDERLKNYLGDTR